MRSRPSAAAAQPGRRGGAPRCRPGLTDNPEGVNTVLRRLAVPGPVFGLDAVDDAFSVIVQTIGHYPSAPRLERGGAASSAVMANPDTTDLPGGTRAAGTHSSPPGTLRRPTFTTPPPARSYPLSGLPNLIVMEPIVHRQGLPDCRPTDTALNA